MADINLDSMSDEEFDNHMNSQPDEVEDIQEDASTENAQENDNTDNIEDTVEDTELDPNTDTETDLDEKVTDTADSEGEVLEPASQDSNGNDEDETEGDTEGDEPETAKDEVDYKAFYTKVTSEYKANGKIMPGIKSPDDLVTALQMASNYAQKTAALKPSLKRVKMLKDVTDEELNEMLDFRARNPEVIKKALKDAKLDPLDIDVDEELSYVPTDHSISDAQIEFEEVIGTIENTPEFETTSKVVSEQWDDASRQAMFDNPKLIVGLNQEVAMGRFDQVSAMMDQARLLGKDNGLNDLALYQALVNTLVKQPAAPVQMTQESAAQTNVQTENPALKEKRTQAGIRPKPKADAVKEYDPTKLSDEEFMKLMESGAKFI